MNKFFQGFGLLVLCMLSFSTYAQFDNRWPNREETTYVYMNNILVGPQRQVTDITQAVRRNPRMPIVSSISVIVASEHSRNDSMNLILNGRPLAFRSVAVPQKRATIQFDIDMDSFQIHSLEVETFGSMVIVGLIINESEYYLNKSFNPGYCANNSFSSGNL